MKESRKEMTIHRLPPQKKQRIKIVSVLMVLVLLVQCVFVSSKAEAVSVTSIWISNATSDGYDVNITGLTDATASYLVFATWTADNGQDDMTWDTQNYKGTNSSYTYHVSRSSHNCETGLYYTNIAVVESDNNVIWIYSGILPLTVSANSYVSNVTSDGYDVNVEGLSDATARYLVFATWTADNGQDDMTWDTQNYKGANSSYTYHVSRFSHHSEIGLYYTNIGVVESNNTVIWIYLGTPNLSIVSGASISNVTSSGYDVTLSGVTDSQAAYLVVATWTDTNGQDDMTWDCPLYTGAGSNYTWHVDVARHNGEYGNYRTNLAVVEGDNTVIWVAELQQEVPPSVVSSQLITANKPQTGMLILPSDRVSYTIEKTANDDFLEAEIIDPVVSGRSLQYTVTIYAPGGKPLASQKSTSGKDYIRCKVTSLGNYFVVVSGDAANYSSTAPYTLTVK